ISSLTAQEDPEGTPLALFALHLNTALMRLYDHFALEQPDAQPLALGSSKWLKQPMLYELSGHTTAMVVYCEHSPARQVLGSNADLAAGIHRLLGIQDQIDQYFLDLCRVELQPGDRLEVHDQRHSKRWT